MFTVTFLNVTIAVKIQRLKISVNPVAIAPRLEKAVCSSLVNAKNVAILSYFILTPRQIGDQNERNKSYQSDRIFTSSNYRSNEPQEKNLKALLSNAFKFFLGLGVKCCKTNNNAITPSFKTLTNNRQFTKESKQGDRLSN
jgi:hypothetical protein